MATQVVHCDTIKDKMSSCSNLLANSLLKSCIWVSALLSLTANGLVLVYRGKAHKEMSLDNVIILNLAAADLLMSVYLTGVGIADHWFSGRYALVMDKWKVSIPCKFLGAVAALSTEMSLFLLVFLSAFYLLAIGYGKGSYFAHQSKMLVFCICSWAILIVFGFTLPILGITQIQSGSCLYFHLAATENSTDLGWYYNLFFYVIFNSVLMLTSAIFCTTLMWKIHSSSQKLKQQGSISGGRKMVKTYMWLMVLLLSNLMCWLPFEGLMVISLSGYRFDPAVVHWFSILVLPLNSLTNPFLYTVRLMRRN